MRNKIFNYTLVLMMMYGVASAYMPMHWSSVSDPIMYDCDENNKMYATVYGSVFGIPKVSMEGECTLRFMREVKRRFLESKLIAQRGSRAAPVGIYYIGLSLAILISRNLRYFILPVALYQFIIFNEFLGRGYTSNQDFLLPILFAIGLLGFSKKVNMPEKPD